MTGFAAHQDTAHRTGRADPRRRIATFDFVRGCVGKIGPVPFSRMNNEHVMFAGGSENLAQRRNCRLQARNIVAERLAEAAGFEKIPLHVDDHERGAIKIDGQRRWLGIKGHFRHLGPPCNRIGEGYALTVQD